MTSLPWTHVEGENQESPWNTLNKRQDLHGSGPKPRFAVYQLHGAALLLRASVSPSAHGMRALTFSGDCLSLGGVTNPLAGGRGERAA